MRSGYDLGWALEEAIARARIRLLPATCLAAGQRARDRRTHPRHSRNRRWPSLLSSNAYDTVALSSGLVSALGPDGIGRRTLESQGGFTGSTGFFRFRADGSSERTMPLYRIGKDGLKEIDASVASF